MKEVICGIGAYRLSLWVLDLRSLKIKFVDKKIFKLSHRSLFQVYTDFPWEGVFRGGKKPCFLSLLGKIKLSSLSFFVYGFIKAGSFVSSWPFLIGSFFNLCPPSSPNGPISCIVSVFQSLPGAAFFLFPLSCSNPLSSVTACLLPPWTSFPLNCLFCL